MQYDLNVLWICDVLDGVVATYLDEKWTILEWSFIQSVQLRGMHMLSDLT